MPATISRALSAAFGCYSFAADRVSAEPRLYVLSTAGTRDIDQTGLVDIAVDDGAQFYCRRQSGMSSPVA